MTRRIPVWAHVVAYGLILLAVAAMTDLTSSWTSDDGAYAVQTRLANDTQEWGYEERPSWAPRPDEHLTLMNSQVSGGIEFPYVKHPIWIDALRLADRLDLPVVGLHLFSLGGALLAAWAASRITTGGHVVRSVAFWAVALGPPLVWATGLWAHALAAGLGGSAAIGLAGWVTRRSWWSLCVLALSTGGLVLLRSEGLLLGLAVVAALLAASWWGDRRPVRLAAAVASVVLAVGAAQLVEQKRVASIAGDMGSLSSPSGSGSWLTGRFSGFTASFTDAGYFDRSATAIGLLGLLLLAVGAVRLARGCDRPQPDRAGRFVVLAGVAVLALRYLWFAEDLVPGVLAAAPILVVGLATLRWSSCSPVERVLSVLVGIYAGFVIATQYPEGGGTEWGGRFLAPVFVAAVALAVGALCRAIASGSSSSADTVATRSWRTNAAAIGVVAALILLPVVPAVAATNKLRNFQDGVTADVEATGAPTAIGLYPAAMLLAWRTVPDVAWAVTTPDDARDLVARARNADEDDLVVVGGGDVDLSGLGFAVEQLSPYVRHLTLESPASFGEVAD